MKKVNILAFNGAEDIELFTVLDILKRVDVAHLAKDLSGQNIARGSIFRHCEERSDAAI